MYKERTINDFLNNRQYQATGMNVHVHVSYYHDTEEANDVEKWPGILILTNNIF